MVRPLQQGTDAAVDEFIGAFGIRVIAASRDHARRAAALRARHRSLRLPDAWSLATAIEANAELLTLDRALHRIAVQERETGWPSRPDS